jgi:hypothetical protein
MLLNVKRIPEEDVFSHPERYTAHHHPSNLLQAALSRIAHQIADGMPQTNGDPRIG